MPQNSQCPIAHIELTNFGANIVLDDASLAGMPAKPANVIEIVDITAGSTLSVVYENGRTATYSALTAGKELLGHFKQINSAGTALSKVRVSWLP